jgi:6,7-dimethyl-8-ribityllumazine synthase
LSGKGAPQGVGTVGRLGLEVVIIAGTWHEVITDGLIAGAQRGVDAAGATWRLVRVPGSFELAVAAQASFAGGADAVVALGVIIRGGHPHFEYVSSATTDGLTRVALDAGKPVGFGVLTLDDEQHGHRSGWAAGSPRGQRRRGGRCRRPPPPWFSGSCARRPDHSSIAGLRRGWWRPAGRQ